MSGVSDAADRIEDYVRRQPDVASSSAADALKDIQTYIDSVQWSKWGHIYAEWADCVYSDGFSRFDDERKKAMDRVDEMKSIHWGALEALHERLGNMAAVGEEINAGYKAARPALEEGSNWKGKDAVAAFERLSEAAKAGLKYEAANATLCGGLRGYIDTTKAGLDELGERYGPGSGHARWIAHLEAQDFGKKREFLYAMVGLSRSHPTLDLAKETFGFSIRAQSGTVTGGWGGFLGQSDGRDLGGGGAFSGVSRNGDMPSGIMYWDEFVAEVAWFNQFAGHYQNSVWAFIRNVETRYNQAIAAGNVLKEAVEEFELTPPNPFGDFKPDEPEVTEKSPNGSGAGPRPGGAGTAMPAGAGADSGVGAAVPAGGGADVGAGTTMPAGAGAGSVPPMTEAELPDDLASGGTAPSALGGLDAPEQDTTRGVNPVTGRPLDINPDTGEPYPIDPTTGEPITDLVSDTSSLTVQHGGKKITIMEPDGDGSMGITVDDGSGDPKEYALDFGDGGIEGQFDGVGPDGDDRAGGGADADGVYRPDAEGKIRIEDGDVKIVAEQPLGPDGATVVTIDDGAGELSTHLLGDDAAIEYYRSVLAEDESALADARSAMEADSRGVRKEQWEMLEARETELRERGGSVAGDGGSGGASVSSGFAGGGGVGSGVGVDGSAIPDSAFDSAGGSAGLGDASGLDAGSRSGVMPPGAAGLATAAGGESMMGGSSSPQTGGGMAGGGMMGGMGAGAGGSGENQERQSQGLFRDDDLFDPGISDGPFGIARISDSLDDSGS